MTIAKFRSNILHSYITIGPYVTAVKNVLAVLLQGCVRDRSSKNSRSKHISHKHKKKKRRKKYHTQAKRTSLIHRANKCNPTICYS